MEPHDKSTIYKSQIYDNNMFSDFFIKASSL